MLNYVIKAILNEDGSVAWQVNGNSVPVARLMAHQRAVQRIELATNGFIINDGETVKVSFFNPEKSLKVDEETMFKRDGLQEWFLSVPALVHNTPGEWEAQFFIVGESGNVSPSQKNVSPSQKNVSPSQKAVFVEYSSIKSAGIEMVTEEQVAELWENANTAKRVSEEAKNIATEKAKNAANSASECEEIKREILENKGAKVFYGDYILASPPNVGSEVWLLDIPSSAKSGDIFILPEAILPNAVIRLNEVFPPSDIDPYYTASGILIGCLPKEEVKPAKMYRHNIRLSKYQSDVANYTTFSVISSKSTALTAEEIYEALPESTIVSLYTAGKSHILSMEFNPGSPIVDGRLYPYFFNDDTNQQFEWSAVIYDTVQEI